MTGHPIRRRVDACLGAILALVLAAGPGPSGSLSSATADDVFDPDEPPETKYQLAPFLTFGAEIEVVYEYRKNLSLDERPDNDASVLEPELSLALSFDPDPRFQAFLNVAVTPLSVLKIEADQSKPSEDVTVSSRKRSSGFDRSRGGSPFSSGASDSRTSASGSTTRSSTR